LLIFDYVASIIKIKMNEIFKKKKKQLLLFKINDIMKKNKKTIIIIYSLTIYFISFSFNIFLLLYNYYFIYLLSFDG